MAKEYRKGAIGAMTDLYEIAIGELKTVLIRIPGTSFIRTNDASLENDFQSIRNIMLHLVRSGYAYANYIRKSFDNPVIAYDVRIETIDQAFSELDEMFKYTLETFEDKWLLTDDELMRTIITTSWTTYDLEALIEHAVIHIMRHRLQIEKMILKFELL